MKFRFMLESKIHRATVTQADLDCEGSLTLVLCRGGTCRVQGNPDESD